MKPNKRFIDVDDLNRIILNYIGTNEIDRFIDCSVYKDDPRSRNAIIYGMCIVPLLSIDCESFYISNEEKEESKEEKMSYEELEADRDDYKKRFKEMVELTNKLQNAFLGEGYCIGCSCGEPQASEIIIDEIIEKFAPKPEKPNKNWIFNRFGQR